MAPIFVTAYHSSNHDDLWSNVLLDVEELEEAYEVECQGDGVQHACPNERLPRQCETQYDRHDEQNVDNLIELIPRVTHVLGQLIAQRLGFR